MTSVEIPLQGSDTEVIEIAFDELPDDVEEVMHILKAENAQMHLWVTIAIEYYRRDKKENFTRVTISTVNIHLVNRHWYGFVALYYEIYLYYNFPPLCYVNLS